MASQAPASSLDLVVLRAALQPRSALPLHQQLESALRSLIRSGQVSLGSAIPGELELAEQLQLSRHTIRHALGVLTSEGLLRRERGRGTTVVSDGTPPALLMIPGTGRPGSASTASSRFPASPINTVGSRLLGRKTRARSARSSPRRASRPDRRCAAGPGSPVTNRLLCRATYSGGTARHKMTPGLSLL